ncbi:MAG: class I SAM-dependent methyltransferase [Acidobacteria bacterium]|nr:class I SAM-dependent methyltransferase [Acidobacteriota bacterium]
MNLWQLLDNPVVWEVSRFALDLSFSLYRKRVALLNEWELLKDDPSVVDIGCGIGSYSRVTGGEYMGIDLNCRFIDYARRKHRRPNQSFRCVDATTLVKEQISFNLALMVDFLHHLSDEQCVQLLSDCSRLAEAYVINFEPVTQQHNPVGRWIVEHDRGENPRPLDALHHLFEEANLASKDCGFAFGFLCGVSSVDGGPAAIDIRLSGFLRDAVCAQSRYVSGRAFFRHQYALGSTDGRDSMVERHVE